MRFNFKAFDITSMFSLDDGKILVDTTAPNDVDIYNLKIIAEIEEYACKESNLFAINVFDSC